MDDKQVKVVGHLNIQIKYGNQEEKLVLVVMDGDGPNLFGRNRLKYLNLEWKKSKSVRST